MADILSTSSSTAFRRWSTNILFLTQAQKIRRQYAMLFIVPKK